MSSLDQTLLLALVTFVILLKWFDFIDILYQKLSKLIRTPKYRVSAKSQVFKVSVLKRIGKSFSWMES